MTNHDDDPATKSGSKGDASADTSTPFTPRKDDDTPVGDTDQHSKADHHADPAKDIKPTNAAND
jgi:hypothetical protein